MGQKKNFSKNSDNDYTLRPSLIFLKQLSRLDKKAKRIIRNKLLLLKQNPFRYKRIKGYSLSLFRIRIENNRKEKRVVYFVDKNEIKIVCILNRSDNYKDLINYL